MPEPLFGVVFGRGLTASDLIADKYVRCAWGDGYEPVPVRLRPPGNAGGAWMMEYTVRRREVRDGG
jgi:hypothetical protein